MNCRSQYFEFRVKFRPEGQDNPSTSFSLESASVLPVRGNPYPQIAIMLPLVESAEAEERARGTKGFLGNFICVCE
jgi:hypothetical protein